MDREDDDEVEGQSACAEGENFRLRLVSYGRANEPLLTTAADQHQLLFSVRDMPGPPSRLLKTHTGLSSHLRKEVLASEGARLRLAEIESAVVGQMVRLEEEGIVAGRTTEEEQDGRANEDLSLPPPPSSEAQARPQLLLQIGVFCEEGKHHSVSFVHELGRCRQLKRPGWTVSILHRDLGVGDGEAEDSVPRPAKAKRKRERERKKGRSLRVGAVSSDEGG